MNFDRRVVAMIATCIPVIALALLESMAAASPSAVTFHGTETLVVDYVGDNGSSNEAVYGDDDEFWASRNVFDLKVDAPKIGAGLRFDTALFQRPPAPVDPDRFVWGKGASGYTLLNYQNDFRLERVYGKVTLGTFEITAGDFYTSFGRGMVLSLVKIDDLGVDNALRGARIEYELRNQLKLTLLGGIVNMLNVDPYTHVVLPDDPQDRIAGARVELRVAESLRTGVHGVLMRPR